MKRFAQLFIELDRTTKTSRKLEALKSYFAEAESEDAAWAVYFLSGEKLKRLIPTKLLRQWAAKRTGIADWLFDECYEAVGDLAETITLMLPPPTLANKLTLAGWVEDRLLPMRELDESEQQKTLMTYWDELDEASLLVLHKLITGSFRVGVSRQSVVKALANLAEIDAGTIAHRLMGDWTPSAEFFRQLVDPATGDAALSQPYPFYLASPLESGPEDLGDTSDFYAEWKWDGIRAQLLKRDGEIYLWSRGEELITERFPEIAAAAAKLPDGVALDGEILAWRDDTVLPFNDLQRRIGRKRVGKKLLAEVPTVLMAFDVLEHNGEDVRSLPLLQRHAALDSVVSEAAKMDANFAIRLSPQWDSQSWDELAQIRQRSREQGVEGLMLKRRSSPYRVGRPRGDWWKWKVDPYTIDAVLTYAQRGSGRRASLYTDYTFGVWDGDELVTLAKAYSGLTDEEIAEVDRFVRANTVERFGPVRQVKPELVFELAFEAIHVSTRHRSGIAVRFPRIARWRRDLPIEQADELDSVKQLARS